MSSPMSAQEHMRAAREFFNQAQEVTSHEGRVEALLASTAQAAMATALMGIWSDAQMSKVRM